jgi:hypothetical protein
MAAVSALPRGSFDMVRLFERPLVDRLLFELLFFDLALFFVARLAGLPLRRFVWVPRFPLIFFLPELRFCRAISSSPRIRAPPRMCSTPRTCKERTSPRGPRVAAPPCD